MKFIKVIQTDSKSYYAVSDVLPNHVYSHDGNNYIGKAFDNEGNLVGLHYFKYAVDPTGMKAFSGKPIIIPMDDGTSYTLVDNYWDSSIPSRFGTFVEVRCLTDAEAFALDKSFYAKRYLMPTATFNTMLQEYLLHDHIYSMQEFRDFYNKSLNQTEDRTSVFLGG